MASKLPNAFAKHVGPYRHPGIKAHPFLRPALKKGFELLKKLAPAAIVKASKRVGRGSVLEVAMGLELEKAVRTAALWAAAEAARLAPKRTGNLRQHISAQPRSPLLWTVGTNVHYAPHLEYGTKPFMMPIIYPKYKSCLAWYDKSRGRNRGGKRRGK